MDYRELATKIREKHPGAYDDMDDAALARAIARGKKVDGPHATAPSDSPSATV